MTVPHQRIARSIFLRPRPPQTGHVQWMEVGDEKKKVKLITRAITPLIFGKAFVTFFWSFYIVLPSLL